MAREFLRRGQLIRRALVTVDVMAPCRRGKTASQWRRLVNERMGESYCTRTIRRDLLAMAEIGLVEVTSETTRAGERHIFRLVLDRTAGPQQAAISVLG